MAMLIFMQFHHGEWSAENLFIFPENVTHPRWSIILQVIRLFFRSSNLSTGRPAFLQFIQSVSLSSILSTAFSLSSVHPIFLIVIQPFYSSPHVLQFIQYFCLSSNLSTGLQPFFSSSNLSTCFFILLQAFSLSSVHPIFLRVIQPFLTSLSTFL